MVQRHGFYKSQGLLFLDTTVKSGNPIFAPSWQIVMNVKEGIITPEEYTVAYRQMMVGSYRSYKSEWVAVVQSDKPVVVCCYCVSGKFCHRHLLINYFSKVALKHELPFTNGGEYPSKVEE